MPLPRFSAHTTFWCTAALCLLPLIARSASAPLPVANVSHQAPVDYDKEIYPLLKANCISCHNKTTTKGDFNMETPALMKKGGENGEGFVPGKGQDSQVFQAAAHIGDSTMPPKGNKVGAVNLTPEELGLLKLWIDQGAKGGEHQVAKMPWEALPSDLTPIYSVAITPDGEFAACGRANQIFLYDLRSRTLLGRLADEKLTSSGLYPAPGVAHRDLVESLAFSPDGSRLASGSYGEVKIWKRVDAKPEQTPAAPQASPAPAAAKSEALTAAQKKVEKALDRPTLQRLSLIKRAATAALQEATYQNEVARTAETDIKAMDDRLKKTQGAKALVEKNLPEKRQALPKANEAKAAAEKAAKDTSDLLAKAPNDAALAEKNKDAQAKLEAAVMKRNEAEMAVKSLESSLTDATKEIQLITENHTKSTEISTQAKKAADTAKAAEAKATQELAEGTKAATAAIKPILSAALSQDKKTLATAYEGGIVRLWVAETGVPLATYETKLPEVDQLRWSGDEAIAATAKDGSAWKLKLYPHWVLERTLGTGQIQSPIVDRANAVRFSPDGATLAVGSGEPSRSGDITLWNIADGKLLQTWAERHHDTVLSLDYSPDGKLLASGGADKAVRVSEVNGGKVVKVFEGHTHHVLGVAWRADGRVLASAGADNTVKVWDYLTGDRKKNVEGWDKEVTSIQFLGASNQFITTSGDNKVREVNDSGGEVRVLAGVTDFMESGAASRNGDVLVAGGQDSKLRIWDGETGKELGVLP